MPVKKEVGLKRPDLRGEFPCAHCGTVLIHMSSLNRHVRVAHTEEQKCLLCHRNMEKGEGVRAHMEVEHGIKKVWTCGCCRHVFRTKKEMCNHQKVMKTSGEPGEDQPIAIGSLPPGSMTVGRSTSSGNPPETEMPRNGWLDQLFNQHSANSVAHVEVGSKAASSSGESGIGSVNGMGLSPFSSTYVSKEGSPESDQPSGTANNRNFHPLDIEHLLGEDEATVAGPVEIPCMDDVVHSLANAPKMANISPERQNELNRKRKSIHEIVFNLQAKKEKKPDPTL